MTKRGPHQRNDRVCECGRLYYCTNCHDACPECLGIHLVPTMAPGQPEAPQPWSPAWTPVGDYGTYTDPDVVRGGTTLPIEVPPKPWSNWRGDSQGDAMGSVVMPERYGPCGSH